MRLTYDLSYLSFVAIQAVLQAGEILRRGFGTAMKISAKPGRQNFVTEYDHASEACILNFIQSHFPDHAFLAEERGYVAGVNKDQITWIIDPLDGTTNFSRQIPLYTISVAAYHGEDGLCGVVYQPSTNELFVAEKGKGAYLNGTRLYVSQVSQLSDSVLGTGFPNEVPETESHFKQFVHFIQTGATIRNIGSAALNLAYVAAGKVDGFWMHNLHPWDIAAARLLIEEAGGEVTCFDGTPPKAEISSSLLGTNKLLHPLILAYC